MNIQEQIVTSNSKHYYRFAGLPDYWVDDNDDIYYNEFFEDKVYNDYYFDNFLDMDKTFGHEDSLFGTKGLPVGDPKRKSKSFDTYNEMFGPMIVRLVNDDENLQEQISRIKTMMGVINENRMPPRELLRRINFSETEIFFQLKEWLMRLYESNKKETTISKAIDATAGDIVYNSGVEYTEDEFVKLSDKIKDYLEIEFREKLESFYDSMFSFEDDNETYCFYKHSDRNMDVLKNRGFGECVKGWHTFLSKFGYWFSDIDWNEVRQKVNSKPNTKILIKRPLENHKYEYYFSVSKVEKNK